MTDAIRSRWSQEDPIDKSVPMTATDSPSPTSTDRPIVARAVPWIARVTWVLVAVVGGSALGVRRRRSQRRGALDHGRRRVDGVRHRGRRTARPCGDFADRRPGGGTARTRRGSGVGDRRKSGPRRRRAAGPRVRGGRRDLQRRVRPVDGPGLGLRRRGPSAATQPGAGGRSGDRVVARVGTVLARPDRSRSPPATGSQEFR